MAGCGVLVLTAAGLSLVFPDAWYRPLPGTIGAADDAKASKGQKKSGSYSLPFDEVPVDFVYSGDDNAVSGCTIRPKPVECFFSLTDPYIQKFQTYPISKYYEQY